MRYAHPTGADPQSLYAFASRLIDDLNRNTGARIDGLRQVTASETVTGSDYFLEVDASAGPVSITLPDRTLGRTLIFKKTDATANAVYLIGQIDDLASFTMTTPNQSISIIGGTGQWLIT